MLQRHIISERRFTVNNPSISYSNLVLKSDGEKSEKEMFTFNVKRKYELCLDSAAKTAFFTENKVNAEIILR